MEEDRLSRSLVAAVAGLALLALSAWGLAHAIGSVNRLRKTGVRVEAQIIGSDVGFGIRPLMRRAPTISVTYPTPEGTYTAILPEDLSADPIGEVEVVYARDNPSDVVSATGPAASSVGALGIVSIAGLILGGLMLALGMWVWLRDLRAPPAQELPF